MHAKDRGLRRRPASRARDVAKQLPDAKVDGTEAIAAGRC